MVILLQKKTKGGEGASNPRQGLLFNGGDFIF